MPKLIDINNSKLSNVCDISIIDKYTFELINVKKAKITIKILLQSMPQSSAIKFTLTLIFFVQTTLK